MGTNAFVVALKSKEYIELPKGFYANYENEDELYDDMQPSEVNALLRFLNEHSYEEIKFGHAQYDTEFIQRCGGGDYYDLDVFKAEWTKLPYSKGT